MHHRLAFAILALLLAVSAAATESPLERANAFWNEWARGDVAAAVATWDPARVERFRELFQREDELRCARVLHASLRLSRLTPATAMVDVDATVERFVAATGRTEIEDEHHVIELRASGTQWQVVAFQRREDAFADALVRLNPAERDARLAEVGPIATPRLAVALSRRAILLSSRQRDDDARALRNVARRIAEETESDVARSAVLAAESVDRRRNAPHNDTLAVQLAEEAERLALRSGDPDAIGRARIRLARAIEGIDSARAEALLLDVLDSADAIFDTSTLAIAASQLAWTCGDRLEHARGFRYSLLASRYAELSDDPSARLNAAMNLAGAYLGSGDVELAKLHYERLVAVARESDAIAAQVYSLRWVAELEPQSDREPAAIAEGLALASCAGDPIDAAAAPLLVIRARLATRRGHVVVARKALDAAYALISRTVIDDRFHADALAAEAELLIAERRPREALTVLDAADAIVAPHPEWESERGWNETRASALRSLGRREEAIAVLRSGAASIERARTSLLVDPRARQSFFRNFGLHDQLVELLVEAKRNEEALAVADQRTARTLLDLVGSPDSRKGPESPEIERAERTVVELNRLIFAARPNHPSLKTLRERLAAARLQLDDLRIRNTAEHGSLVLQTTPATIDLARTDPRFAIVRYVVTAGQSFVFVVRNGDAGPRVTAHRLTIGEHELDRRVSSMLERIDARDLDYRSAARMLHDSLIAPIAADLRGAGGLAIIPDGPLWRLPFQTLIDTRGRDLLARFEIRYAPSITWLLRDATPFHRPASILALGDPEIGATGQATARALVPGRTLGQLPDAALEAREAARLYPHSRVLTGAAADESSIKEQSARYDVVHVAAHALIDEKQPLYSSLVLATHNADDDGLLEARELLSLNLDSELFVLSACGTAGGRSYRGEGVVGLAWALLANGVPHAVVSQWNADSRATRKLMVAFHRHLVAGESPSSALRHAQLELRQDVRYEDPLYWAAFVVLGSSAEARSPATFAAPRALLVTSTQSYPRHSGAVPR